MTFWSFASQVHSAHAQRKIERARAEERKRNHRRTTRLNFLMAVSGVVAVAFSIFWYASDVRARPDPPTEVQVFDFYTVDTSGMDSQPVECLEISIASFRPDAHRCFGDNLIFDPCFDAARAGETRHLLCPAILDQSIGHALVESPPFKDLDELFPPDEEPEPAPELDDREVRAGDLNNMAPWALKLDEENYCVFTSGATWVVSETRLNFVCDSGFVYGMPDISESTWTVLWSEHFSYEGHNIVRVPVRKALL